MQRKILLSLFSVLLVVAAAVSMGVSRFRGKCVASP
jgi:hypothetical protein